MDNPEGRDLTVDAVVDPEGNDKRLLKESEPKLPADTAFDVDDRTEGRVYASRIHWKMGNRRMGCSLVATVLRRWIRQWLRRIGP